MTQGQTIEEAWNINPEKVAAFLETLPDDHYHCAELSVGGFYLALSDFQKNNFRKNNKDRLQGAGTLQCYC